LRAFDDEIRRKAGANHVSQLVLRLGPGFDVEIFRKLIHQVAHAQPILRAPIGRRLGLGAPVYRLASAPRSPMPPIHVVDADPPAAMDPSLPRSFAKRLNEPMASSRGELLRFDVIRYAAGTVGTDLVVSWLHMLFDGAGSEIFMGWLDACYRGASSPDELPCHDELTAANTPAQPLGERGEAARTWQSWLGMFRAHPPHSLAGPLRRTRQALGYRRLTLSSEQTAIAVEMAAKRAGFLTPTLFYLAVAIRAHHAVFRERGVDPGSYVVPLAVNFRPKGGAKAMFRTHVSIAWFQILPGEVDDLEGLIATLKEQRLDAIKTGQIENAVHAMDFARFAPKRLYAHMARRDFAGELCSFFFAYTGDFMSGVERFLGAEIRDGFHVAPVPPSPGSCVAISLRGGRLNATHVSQAGVFSPRELEIFREQLKNDLHA
jgi:hypothetical protein